MDTLWTPPGVMLEHLAALGVTVRWEWDTTKRAPLLLPSPEDLAPGPARHILRRNYSDLLNYLDPHNDPAQYDQLTKEQKQRLTSWLMRTFVPDPKRRANRCRDSYVIKHALQGQSGGFYVTNGAMKGALLVCEFPIIDRQEMNWRTRMKRRRPCPYPLTDKRGRERVCHHEPDLLTGVCRYHQRRERGL